MKQVFSILAFCLVLGCSSGLMAQSSMPGRAEIPFTVACEIIDQAQQPLWYDVYKTTPELIQWYQRGVLTITQLSGKSTFRVDVRGCRVILVLLEDL